MENTEKKLKNCEENQCGSLIRTIILIQSLTFIFNGIVWTVKGDFDKWFSRWALGMILLSAYGIMKHFSIKNNHNPNQ